jgi:hypothetical protein
MDANRLSLLIAGLKELNKGKTGSKFKAPKKGTDEYFKLFNLMDKEKTARKEKEYLSKISKAEGKPRKELTSLERLDLFISGGR